MFPIFAQGIGIPDTQTASQSSLGCVGAATPTTYVAFGFEATETGELSKFRCWFGTTGSPVDVRVSLYADDGTGKPSSSGPISGSESTGIAISNGAIAEFTWPAGVGITKGTRYHVVIKNYTAGTTASAFYIAGMIRRLGNHNTVNLTKYSTTTGDVGWGSGTNSVISGVLELTNGQKMGAIGRFGTTSYSSNADRVVGARFFVPDGLVVSALGVSGCFFKSGTPTFDLYPVVFINGVQVALGSAINMALISSSIASVFGMLTSVVIAEPGDVVRVGFKANGGDSSNYLRQAYFTVGDSDLDTRPMSACRCVSEDGGATWTDYNNDLPPFWLQGTVSTFFESAPINRRSSVLMR